MSRLSYQDRMDLLRETKQRHTFEKRAQKGYTDEDDYGNIPVPEDFHYAPESN